MARFNRNIITQDDITNLLNPGFSGPAGLPESPPSVPTGGSGDGTTGPAPTPTRDDFLTVLLKYVPLEIVGFYLFLEGLVKSGTGDNSEPWLLVLLAVTVLVILPLYMRRVLRVIRKLQIVVGAVGLTVYVLAFGGWFETQDWYYEWLGSAALAVFAIAVRIARMPPLPEAD